MITLKQFMEEHKDQTLLSFAWSCYWRVILAIYAITFGAYLGVALVVAIFTIAFGSY